MNDHDRVQNEVLLEYAQDRVTLRVHGVTIATWSRHAGHAAASVRGALCAAFEWFAGEIRRSANERAANLARSMGREDIAREILGTGLPPFDEGGPLQGPRT